jgi:formylglycine-generating enzyme required for sulfatase activity
MALLPGEILKKRYRIVNLLAEGSYGAVYRAWDIDDKFDVAIKEYLDPSHEIQRLFRDEASRLSRLKHPQLPKVLDHFCLDDVGQYLISEYVDGENLQELLDNYGPLPSDLIISYLQAACQPLVFIHENKQLHLDIKPANIRIVPSGEVFLVDTGLPGLGVSVGSSGFAAPEQQMQGTVSSASDIYSLGATLYTLLTGSAPPDALHRESGLSYLDAARDVNPNVEPYLSMVATRAMDLRPDARYESAKVFIQALERPAGWSVSQQEGPRRTEFDQNAPPPRLPQKRRKKMEQRTILALSAVLLIIIGFVIGLVYAGTRPEVLESQAAATSTIESQVIAALTAITTVTPSPAPSATPVPTPEPVVDETTGARMIYVPGGIFRLGDNDGESDESPSHIVKLDPFFIDETEATNGQYDYCVDEGVCDPPSRPGATFHRAYYGDPAFDDYPVIFVNWFNARDYCAWRGARLPSEAEWERAAGFDPVQAIKYRYPWGEAFDGTVANFCDTNCPQSDKNIEFDDGHNDTAPVATFPDGASPFGLYDMAGNVMEWVSDWYDPRYYEESTDTNPLGPLEGEFKSLRGGSWLSSENEVRTSGRSSYLPSVSRANLGFRCAMTAP